MKKILLLFFLGIVFFDASYGQYTTMGIGGSADKRVVIGWIRDRPDYVPATTPNIWNTTPYNSIVSIYTKGSAGTGEFVSPRHILTNAHVAAECGMNGRANCMVYTSDGQTLSAREVFYGITGVGNNMSGGRRWRENQDKDWAILEITDNYCRPEYRNIEQAGSATTGLWRAGFGSLRVLTQNDINLIRQAYIVYLNANKMDDKHPERSGMFIGDHDPNYLTKYKVFFDEFTRLTGKDFNKDYNNDGWTLKLIRNCRFNGNDDDVSGDSVVFHTCDSWGGDSGSNIKNMSNNNVVGLNYGSWSFITTYTGSRTDINSAILAYKFMNNPNIQSAIQRAKQDCGDGKALKPEIPTDSQSECDLRCDHITVKCNDDYNINLLSQKCFAATGKRMVRTTSASGPFVFTCVDYDKTEQCAGATTRNQPPQLTDESVTTRQIGGQCLESDLPRHSIGGHYISNGTNKLMCGDVKCSCAATECEDGFYLAANAKGYSMGWCRSGYCPKGKHPNIVGGNKMIGCEDD